MEGHGNEGFGLIFSLNSTQPILLCGVSIFLPHHNFIKDYNSITISKDGWDDILDVTIKVNEHGTPQMGPIGKTYRTIKHCMIHVNFD